MTNQRGQSLVEMAIITPILLFMLLGLFEVGYALHNDLIVINVSREAARFATKPGNLTITDSGVIGYDTIVKHSITSAAGQLHNELYAPGESGIIISNIIASVSITDCANGTYHVISPVGREYLTYSTSPDYKSKVDFLAESQAVGEMHRDIACRYLDENGQPLAPPVEHLVIVEMFYTSHQLLGVPFISNSLTDPVMLYSKTTMRKVWGRDE